MHEALLQYLWQNQMFDHGELTTGQGEKLEVLDPGMMNNDAGPDFSGSRVKINGIEWRGDIEVHISASDWLVHGHQNDDAYDKVVLHVVWHDDKRINYKDNTETPVLSLRGRISRSVIEKASRLLSSHQKLPCAATISWINPIHVSDMFSKTVIERLEAKSQVLLGHVQACKGDWEEATYRSLAESMGFKTNKIAMLELAERLPLKILKSYNSDLIKIEALMFGMAGLINSSSHADQYSRDLAIEFDFLSKKHNLPKRVMEIKWWKFMRMRPSNFPTIRIAQLAGMVCDMPSLFSTLLHEGLDTLVEKLQVEQSEYWKNHYQFGKTSKRRLKGLGVASMRGLLINTVGPLLVAYDHFSTMNLKEKAVNLLSGLPREHNRITRMWQSEGVNISNGAESQGSIELFNNYCSKNRCLSCKIGYQILTTDL